ncbi:MAG: hypothetical protein BroJett033_0800 [Chloroflexota bacterium]|nr:MAG: hypothetical protein BroJett033_0800 [Chloroflexota bacterium]
MGERIKILIGSGVLVGKGRDVGGRITTGVDPCGPCVGITGSAVTVTGVGALLVRVGSTVVVGTSVVSIGSCGVLVRLQALINRAVAAARSRGKTAGNGFFDRTIVLALPVQTLNCHNLIIATLPRRNLTAAARHATCARYLWLK